MAHQHGNILRVLTRLRVRTWVVTIGCAGLVIGGIATEHRTPPATPAVVGMAVVRPAGNNLEDTGLLSAQTAHSVPGNGLYQATLDFPRLTT